jgi:DNA (cytosine-5)-methyltransferase 1
MGYQVYFLIMDSWSFSSSQGRERLCILIATPELELITHPWHTYSHPEGIRGRSPGKQYDGVSFGDLEEHDTPFDFTTVGEAAAHLPIIGTRSIQACILSPDHRLAAPMSTKNRIIARHVPIQPPGQGYAEAIKRNLIPHAGRKMMSEVGRSFRRIRKDGLFPTNLAFTILLFY